VYSGHVTERGETLLADLKNNNKNTKYTNDYAAAAGRRKAAV
jgi:hypothetical protein